MNNFVGILLVICSSVQGIVQYENEVQLSDGTRLRGTTSPNGVTAFKGVPYAAAPIGDLRFSPPKKWENPHLDDVVDATQYGSPCKQHYFDGNEIGSEDCLFLNVWADMKHSHLNSSVRENVPVAVYIHGGSYMSGMGNDIEGGDFVEYWRGRAIVVSMNYRLNVFGFSGSDALRSQDIESGSTGNYGLQDQRLALEWVQRNIEVFGGDVNQVMIFGESAGAGSVTNHLVMPKSKQLFSSAILESGSFVDWVTQPMNVAEAAFDTLLNNVNCSDVNCLLLKPTEVIYQASLGISSTDISYGSPYNPTVDGVELKTHPWISAARGDVADVPILQGTNLDEGSMFVPLKYNASKADLTLYWKIMFSNDEIDILMDLYVTGADVSPYPSLTIDGVEVSDYWWAANRAMADGSFFCGAKYSSIQFYEQEMYDKRKSSTYLYHFEYLADGSDVPFVQHTSEIPFVIHDNTYMASESDFKTTDLMAGYWGAFMSHHNPNINNNPSNVAKPFPAWPSYSSKHDNLLSIGGPSNVHELTHMSKKECDFFISWMDNEINKKFSHE